MLIKVKYKKRHERDSNPRSSVYETDTLPLGHRATYRHEVSVYTEFIKVKYKKRHDKDSIPRSSVYAVQTR